MSEAQFWNSAGDTIFGAVQLSDFRITDWFPRAPGVFWSKSAIRARQNVWDNGPVGRDRELGKYYLPDGKANLIEEGGIGTIRLRPRRIDGVDCWLATALTELHCHGGIPLAIPVTLMREAGVNWGDHVSLKGRVRFLQDAGLDDVAASVHHARPLIVFADELKGVVRRRSRDPIIISPVALFDSANPRERSYYHHAQYTFVQCAAGHDAELDGAGDWIEKYTKKFAGRVITNFDEQRPILADAPLSYQRLVTNTYERTVIGQFHGRIQEAQIDRVIRESVTHQYFGSVHMGNNIHVGGSANINIDSVLTNVTQTIGSAKGLKKAQKSQLNTMVQTLTADLEKLKATHAEETKEIADALQKAIANAAKPKEERKQNLLQLSANGLKEAAGLVKDIAPTVLKTAGQIAKFIVGI
jgi:hypothetical protein